MKEMMNCKFPPDYVSQVVPLSLSVSLCGLMVCRDFFMDVDDFVDEFGN